MHHIMSGYRFLWLAWGAAFLILEFTAIFRRRYQDTLSEFVWDLCRVTPGSTIGSWTAVHFLTAAFMVWLLLHIVFGYFR